MMKEIHNAFPATPAAAPISAYIPAPRIMPTPYNVASTNPIFLFSLNFLLLLVAGGTGLYLYKKGKLKSLYEKYIKSHIPKNIGRNYSLGPIFFDFFAE